MKNPLIVICGPTATGKTKIAIEICKEVNGEIISADSRQIYQDLDIGSGRKSSNTETTTEEGVWVENGVPIHLYNIIKPSEQITVIKYRNMAQEVIKNLWVEGKIPFLVGGTGFYINAVLGDTTIEQIPPNPNLREALQYLSLEKLNEKLDLLDPGTSQTIDKQNRRRLIRAIERAEFKHQRPPPIDADTDISSNPLRIGLTSPREKLNARIERRTEKMLNDGLLDEVRLLLMKYGSEAPALDAIGFRQFIPHLLGEQALEEAIAIKNVAEHQYAKRQMTWFKRDQRINWFDLSLENSDQEKLLRQKITELVKSYLKTYG